ncbi:hypothetical protein R9C00_15155 [Flammeovirgaceae bacterium SG7u.111]|nr:hypothetical protein [Flammeovirgaceae bacterium SG7u.132]WPO33040.1 hypothetical protein R9C00_15155 [Flammeovirgaceae bacterium SG7u.111]
MSFINQTFIFVLLLISISCEAPSKDNKKSLAGSKTEQDVAIQKVGLSNQLFDKNTFFLISQITKGNDYPSSEEDTSICIGWTLTEEEINSIIVSSQELSGSDWHYLFDHLPCEISGKIIQQQNEFKLSINGGSWFTLASKDTTVYFGCFDSSTDKYFLSTVWKEELEEN